MPDYRDLNLDRETLETNIEGFIKSNGHKTDEGIQVFGNRKRIVFGSAGEDFATVDFHLNKTGTTTIQWKLGKNQRLGETLAEHLKNTIDPEEFESVNYAVQGINIDSFESILDRVSKSHDITVDVLRDEDRCKQVKLTSIAYQDQLTLTHHRKTRVLQIQGKPLSCYRRVIFMLTDLLDLKGLEQVLYRKDDSSAEIVRKEMAEEYVKSEFSETYEKLPRAVKKLLISSCCVKLASPKLPDYCLLLYPDLRALEGVLKQQMCSFGMNVGDGEYGFGDFFNVYSGICYLKSEYRELLADNGMEEALNKGYTFYRKHRHTLFHMEEFADGSRMIDTLDKAISLSKEAYASIDGLYAKST